MPYQKPEVIALGDASLVIQGSIPKQVSCEPDGKPQSPLDSELDD
jgi:hypothetical protein